MVIQLFNICLAFLGAYFIHQIEDKVPIIFLRLVEIIFVSLLLLIFGEVIPKVFAMRNSLKFSQTVYLPLKSIFILFKPIIFFFDKLVELFHSLISIKNEKIFDSEEELKILTELGEEQGTLEEEESEMIQSIIEFNNKEAGEILTPRVDIIGIDASSSLDDVMDLISREQFSKIPVFNNLYYN